jgi:hypothetical protein
VFYGELVVAGSLGAQGATITAVQGTSGATGYSLAEGGSSIVFTQRNSNNLTKVPTAGGAPVVAALVTPRSGVQLLGVSCRGTTCVVAVAPVTLWASAVPGPPQLFASINASETELRGVSLTTGEATTLMSLATLGRRVFSSPLIVPNSSDVVAHLGQMIGHLQTVSSSSSDLHLYRGIVP